MTDSVAQIGTVAQTRWHQSIGATVSSTPAPPPARVTLSEKTITLEPLSLGHAANLYPVVEGEDKGHVWTYLGDEPPRSLEEFQQMVATKSRSEDPLFFSIVHNETKTPVGWASLMRIDTKNRGIEVGNILFSPSLQRTRAATEAMYALAKYVFEELGYRRYEWKCDNFNTPSQRAARRLGFSFEGVFRQHMIYKNRTRDTAWFSMIDSEWPMIRRGFEAWLDDANFDQEGKQLHRLEELRGPLPE